MSRHSNRRCWFRVSRTGQEPGLGQDLESVAHSEHVAAAVGVPSDGRHDRAHLGDGAATQVVAVRKKPPGIATMSVPSGSSTSFVPGHHGGHADDVAKRVDHFRRLHSSLGTRRRSRAWGRI